MKGESQIDRLRFIEDAVVKTFSSLGKEFEISEIPLKYSKGDD